MTGIAKNKDVYFNNKSWDEKGPYEYFGTGLLSLSGSNSNFTFSVQNPDISITDISGSGPWFTFTTVIPQTPAPQLQHAEAHYHYNTIIVSTSHYKKFYTSKTVLFTTKCYRNSKTKT